jgi:hypothetical protein
LGGNNPGGAIPFDANTATQKLAEGTGFVTPGIGAISEQNTFEQALREASDVIICGVAPRSLVTAMHVVADEIVADKAGPSWDTVRYVTPKQSLIYANRQAQQLGVIVQRWQSALTAIRNCMKRILPDFDESTQSDRFSIRGVDDPYLGVIVILKVRHSQRRRAWVSVGPTGPLENVGFIVVEDHVELFQRLEAAVQRMEQSGARIITRQLEAELVPADANPAKVPEPRVTTLRAFGADPANNEAACLPVAIIVLRSATAGEPLVLLKRRSALTDTDDFGKLSLLSARLLETDLAGALNVPLASDQDPEVALDRMWRDARQQGHIVLPEDAFVRAAQREVFLSCGLDIEQDRLRYVGWQSLKREGTEQHLLFCVFVLVLRRAGVDELEQAALWNSDNLVRVTESQLYSETYEKQLNRFLAKRQDWLLTNVFSTTENPLAQE